MVVLLGDTETAGRVGKMIGWAAVRVTENVARHGVSGKRNVSRHPARKTRDFSKRPVRYHAAAAAARTRH